MFSMLVSLLLMNVPTGTTCTYKVAAIVEDVDLTRTDQVYLYPRRVTIASEVTADTAAMIARSAVLDGVVEVGSEFGRVWPPHTVRHVSIYSRCQ